MLRTFPQTQTRAWVRRLVGVAFFAALTALAARARIDFGGPVPITLQTLAVLLAGLVLGARDGALSQAAYLGALALGAPIDTNMAGTAALWGPTAGFLFAFVPVAFVSGLLAERGGNRVWVRWLAGVVGILVLYAFGAAWLKVWLNADWGRAWALGVAPFIAFDLVKALVAAAAAEGGRALLSRFNANP